MQVETSLESVLGFVYRPFCGDLSIIWLNRKSLEIEDYLRRFLQESHQILKIETHLIDLFLQD